VRGGGGGGGCGRVGRYRLCGALFVCSLCLRFASISYPNDGVFSVGL